MLRTIKMAILVALTALLVIPTTALAGGKSPRATFTVSPSSPTTGQQVTFDASASSCFGTGWANSNCSTYSWDDDADNNDPLDSPFHLGSGKTFNFTFQNAGTKYIWLTLTDSSGRQTQTMTPVIVSATPPPPPPSTQCSDGIDNDGDGFVDLADPGCTSSSDNDESNIVSSGCPAWPDFPTSGATSSGCTGYKHTGVTLTPYTGPSSITTAGTVIDGKDITTCLSINAPNVTIKRSYVHCGDGVVVNSTGFLIEDTELNGNGSTGCDWLLGSNSSNTSWTARRIYFYDCSDGLRVNGDMTLVDSYLDGLYNNAGDHNDGMQGYGPGGSATITHNHLDGRTQNNDGMNGVIFFADAWQGDVHIDQNWLAGGAYSLRLQECAHYWVNSNRVLINSYNYGPVFTYSEACGGVIEQWTDNKLRNPDGTDGALFGP